MPMIIDTPNVMHEVEPDVYQAENGFTARREDGFTPNGNPVGWRWVLRDASGAWVDHNQYMHDLFEHHGLRTPARTAARRVLVDGISQADAAP